MIRALVRLLAKTLLELGLVFFLVGGLLLFVAYRCVRRVVTDREDSLESLSGPLLHIAGGVAELAAVLRKHVPNSS
jgi:hypothetical protein